MTTSPFVWVVADDEARRESLRRHLTGFDAPVRPVGSGGALLAAVAAESAGCVVAALDLPDMTGRELLTALAVAAPALQVVIIAEAPSLRDVVQLMRSGAFDVQESPARDLRASVAAALEASTARAAAVAWRQAAAHRIDRLTDRQHEVLRLAIEGHPNKVIAARTGVSVRTVERQRAAAFEALGVTTLTGAVEVLRRAGHEPAVGGNA